MPSAIIVAGREFGKWVVVRHGPRKTLCRCKCGVEKEVFNENLRRGSSVSCVTCARTGNTNRRKGTTEIPAEVYKKLTTCVWNALRRCTNPEHRQWKDYGGRGITVHGPWVEDPYLFVQHLTTLEGHDDPDTLVDRKDNDKGYVPGNLRFVTRAASNKNRRPFGHLLSRGEQGRFTKT